MKNYVQTGSVLTVAAPYDVASGDFAMVGSLFGVATSAALSGAPVEIVTGDVHDLSKTSAQAWTLGQALYWDAAGKVITSTVGSNTKVGVAAAVAANPSGFGRVRLNSSF